MSGIACGMKWPSTTPMRIKSMRSAAVRIQNPALGMLAVAGCPTGTAGCGGTIRGGGSAWIGGGVDGPSAHGADAIAAGGTGAPTEDGIGATAASADTAGPLKACGTGATGVPAAGLAGGVGDARGLRAPKSAVTQGPTMSSEISSESISPMYGMMKNTRQIRPPTTTAIAM